MKQEEDRDHFELLEEKVDILIRYIDTLKEEKRTLTERAEALSREVEHLKATRDKAKSKVLSILERIQQLDI